jgi:hypothetical protein
MFSTLIRNIIANDPLLLGGISLVEWSDILARRHEEEEGKGWWRFFYEFGDIISNAENLFV